MTQGKGQTTPKGGRPAKWWNTDTTSINVPKNLKIAVLEYAQTLDEKYNKPSGVLPEN